MKLRDPLPELDGEMEWLNGKKFIKNELVGEKPVLIYFWSVSCTSCSAGVERINTLFKQYKDQLHLISVHIPRKEEDKKRNAIQTWIDQHQLTSPVIVDQDHVLLNRFRNRSVPAFYLFDKNGELRYLQSGKSNTFLLKKRIERLLL